MEDGEVNGQLIHFDDHAGVLEGFFFFFCTLPHFLIYLFFALTGLHTDSYYKLAGFAVLCPA